MNEMMTKRIEMWETLKKRGQIRGEHYLMGNDQLEAEIRRTEGMTPAKPVKKLVSVKPEPKAAKPKAAKKSAPKVKQPALPKEPPKPTLRDIAMKDPLCIQLQEELIGAVGNDELTADIRRRAAERFAELKKEHGL